jgi:PAT family beta-lactamase induction signal transducer AmpG
MEIYKKQSLAETFSVYFDRRMIKILLLGAISGFPWVIIGSSLSLWLKEDGLSRSTIGWAGLIFAVYAFNYLWAPIIDRVRIPWLTNKIGHRRGWIVLMQAIILFKFNLLEFNKSNYKFSVSNKYRFNYCYCFSYSRYNC